MPIIELKCTPKASKESLAVKKTEKGQVILAKLTEAPDKGKANAALIALLAKNLKLSKSRIKMIKGETSRNKLLDIEISDTALEQWISNMLGNYESRR